MKLCNCDPTGKSTYAALDQAKASGETPAQFMKRHTPPNVNCKRCVPEIKQALGKPRAPR